MKVLQVKALRGGVKSTELLICIVETTVVSREYMRLVLCLAGLQTRRERHCHAGRSEDHPATEYRSPRRQEPIPDGMNEAAEPSRKGS